MPTELQIGSNYFLASKPFHSLSPHGHAVQPRHLVSSPQRCCRNNRKEKDLRVGDSKQLFEDVNRGVEPRYRLMMRDLLMKGVRKDAEARHAKFNFAQQQRKLEGELMRLHKGFQLEMRLHMERPTDHLRSVC